MPSNVSSSSSYRRKRPLAIAVGANHLLDDGRLVVVTPTRKGKFSADSSTRNSLETASFGSGAYHSYQYATSIPPSLSDPSPKTESNQPKWRDGFRQRLGLSERTQREE